MSVMSFEMTQTFNQALKLKTQKLKIFKRNLFIIYFLIGWGLPLLVTVISIIVNFTTNGLVLYGVLSDGTQGSCWINHLESAVVAFVVPVCLSLIFNFTTFIVVSVYLFMASQAQDKVEKHHHISYLRINLAIFTVSGLTWVFGFIAILAQTKCMVMVHLHYSEQQHWICDRCFLIAAYQGARKCSYINFCEATS